MSKKIMQYVGVIVVLALVFVLILSAFSAVQDYRASAVTVSASLKTDASGTSVVVTRPMSFFNGGSSNWVYLFRKVTYEKSWYLERTLDNVPYVDGMLGEHIKDTYLLVTCAPKGMSSKEVQDYMWTRNNNFVDLKLSGAEDFSKLPLSVNITCK